MDDFSDGIRAFSFPSDVGVTLLPLDAEIGIMTEHLAEWWESRGQPVPDFVTEFIARHRASAPPLAVPVREGEPMPEELQAARLALLLMRGTVVMKRPVDENRYIVEPGSTPISRDEAAYRLARMPKPLRWQATVRDGVMAITCRGITEPSERAAWEERARSREKEAGRFPVLREEHGDRYLELAVCCLGWRESLVVTVSEVERYHREYDAHPAGYSAGPPSSHRTQSRVPKRSKRG